MMQEDSTRHNTQRSQIHLNRKNNEYVNLNLKIPEKFFKYIRQF